MQSNTCDRFIVGLHKPSARKTIRIADTDSCRTGGPETLVLAQPDCVFMACSSFRFATCVSDFFHLFRQGERIGILKSVARSIAPFYLYRWFTSSLTVASFRFHNFLCFGCKYRNSLTVRQQLTVRFPTPRILSNSLRDLFEGDRKPDPDQSLIEKGRRGLDQDIFGRCVR